MIFRGLILFILLPLLAIHLIASFCQPTYSAQVNWTVWAIVLLCNCFCYLSKWNFKHRNTLQCST